VLARGGRFRELAQDRLVLRVPRRLDGPDPRHQGTDVPWVSPVEGTAGGHRWTPVGPSGDYLLLRVPYRRWKRSTRPPASTRLLLAGEEGVALVAQFGMEVSLVERVVKVLPHGASDGTFHVGGVMSVS